MQKNLPFFSIVVNSSIIVDENLSNVQTKAKHESTVYINSRYNISIVVQ